MLHIVRAEKVDKKWSHLSSFHVSFLSYGPKLPKKLYFLEFCADLSKKSMSVKAFYIYSSESFDYRLSENDMVYRGPNHRS